MENTVHEMAEVLRSTDTMAEQFADRVRERVGHPVPYPDILDVMKNMSAKRLTMTNVVGKLRRQIDKKRS